MGLVSHPEMVARVCPHASLIRIPEQLHALPSDTLASVLVAGRISGLARQFAAVVLPPVRCCLKSWKEKQKATYISSLSLHLLEMTLLQLTVNSRDENYCCFI